MDNEIYFDHDNCNDYYEGDNDTVINADDTTIMPQTRTVLTTAIMLQSPLPVDNATLKKTEKNCSQQN
jgi:hypothetical protein